ncbi:DNA polymerase III subunit gamma/tau [Bartonella sp. DGB1]|uniref:DNA polymerase III subunit gamma/tau n=1 Tax=Bartonella sp. DGB1 TaxID=3239807 RepID=UPI003524E307
MDNQPLETLRPTITKNYRVLARKYRPQKFNDLIGQEAMVQTLNNSFKIQKIAQAWMLTGVRGVGKTTTARILARALNYQTEHINIATIHMDEAGYHCQSIMDGNHIDVIEMDAASHTGIDSIREIIDQIRYKPVSTRYKIYIIDEIHMLSTQAFNGLLKTLEEPPDHVKFIFATTEIHKVPVTILSRCQRFDLRRVEPNILTAHLAKICELENVTIDKNSLAIIAKASDGSVRDALSILDQAISYSNNNISENTIYKMLGLADQSQIICLFEYLINGQIPQLLDKFNEFYCLGADPFSIISDMSIFTHELTKLKFVPDSQSMFLDTSDIYNQKVSLSKKLSIRSLSRIWQMLLKGLEEVKSAPKPQQAAEMLLIRIAHAADLPHLDQILSKLHGNETIIKIEPNIENQQNLTYVQPNIDTVSDNIENKTTTINNDIKSSNNSIAASTEELETNKTIKIETLTDIIHLLEQGNERILLSDVKDNLKFIALKENKLTIALKNNTNKDFIKKLEKQLKAWTGKHWSIIIANEDPTAQPTLDDQEAENKKLLEKNVLEDNDVNKIFQLFPNSKITSIA